MHKYLVFIAVFCLAVPAMSQNEVDTNGYNVFYYPDGQKSSEGRFENGKPEGFWINYYKNGGKRSEGKREQHLLDSTWVFFDREGDTVKKIDYKDGIKSGFTYKYEAAYGADSSKNMFLKSKELFYQDKQNGTSYCYNQNWLKYTFNYENGKRHGMGKEYNAEGRVISLYKYFKGFLIEAATINRRDSQGRKQGRWVEFYSNGNKKLEVYYRNGKKNGYYREYNRGGTLISETRYENDSLLTAEKTQKEKIKTQYKETYWENGKLKYTGAFKEDKPVGIHKEYAKDGSLKSAKEYNEDSELVGEGLFNTKGKKTARWLLYYPNDQKKASGKFRNGKRHGKWQFFFENGELEQEGFYHGGKLDGEWRWYYPGGNLLKVEYYVNDKLEGKYAEFDQQGDTIQRGTYFDGVKNGDWYYNVGDHTEVGSYKYGLKQGIWKHYYDNGELSFEGNYVDSAEEGIHRWYYDTGKLKERGRYILGKKEGKWRKYNPDGSLFMIMKYENDTLKKINGKEIVNPPAKPKE